MQKLREMPDGDGTMLDHSILLFGSNMSNSNSHNQFPLPTLVLGGGCGQDQGRPAPRLSRAHAARELLLTLLQRAGVSVDKVGDSVGEMTEV